MSKRKMKICNDRILTNCLPFTRNNTLSMEKATWSTKRCLFFSKRNDKTLQNGMDKWLDSCQYICGNYVYYYIIATWTDRRYEFIFIWFWAQKSNHTIPRSSTLSRNMWFLSSYINQLSFTNTNLSYID